MLILIKPDYLNLVWQKTTEFPGIKTGERLIIGKVTEGNSNKEFILEYLKESADYKKYSEQTENKENIGLTAFPVQSNDYPPISVYNHLVDRMPSKKRGDFNLFLHYYGLDKSHAELDEFTLLAYTGSQFSGDGFSLTHPYNTIDNGIILFDIAGYRHCTTINPLDLNDKKIYIKADTDNQYDKYAVAVYLTESQERIGYIPKGQNKTIFEYLLKNDKHHGFIKRINGLEERPNILVQLDLIIL